MAHERVEKPAGQREWETGWVPDQSGTYAFLALCRSKDDPQRSTREQRAKMHGRLDDGDADEESVRASREKASRAANAYWKSIRKLPATDWLPKIENHLADGVARTFNRIMVELADVTADVAAGDDEEPLGPLKALWMLVEQGAVEFTMDIPVLFRSLALHAHRERVRRSLEEF